MSLCIKQDKDYLIYQHVREDGALVDVFDFAIVDDLKQKNSLAKQLEKEKEQLEKQKRALERERSCVVCLDVMANMAFIECGHISVCEACFRKTHITSCPICRADRDNEPLKVFFS
jgi:formate dehydrogenase assembly factor FdhD